MYKLYPMLPNSEIEIKYEQGGNLVALTFMLSGEKDATTA